MADYLEKLGMDFFRESEESARSLISYVAKTKFIMCILSLYNLEIF